MFAWIVITVLALAIVILAGRNCVLFSERDQYRRSSEIWREVADERRHEELVAEKKLKERVAAHEAAIAAFETANDLCRSAYSIAQRDGRETNWDAFRKRLHHSLEIQHGIMYPPPR